MTSIKRLLCGALLCAFVAILAASTANARFITPDTWDPWLVGVDINRYAYSGNDPINGSDPLGHSFGPDTPGGRPDRINGKETSADRQRDAERMDEDWNEAFAKGFESAVNGLFEEAQRFRYETMGIEPWTPFERGWMPQTPNQEAGYAAGRLTHNLGIPLATGAGALRSAVSRPPTNIVPKSTIPREGIYEFPDLTAGGKPYVGQAVNVPNRLTQHRYLGRYAPGTARGTEVLGGKLAREIAEHSRIQQLTRGQKASTSPNVSNMRDPIGPARRSRLGILDPFE